MGSIWSQIRTPNVWVLIFIFAGAAVAAFQQCPRSAQGLPKVPLKSLQGTIWVAFALNVDLELEVWEYILIQFGPKFVLLMFGCSFLFLLELLLLISKPQRFLLSSVRPPPFSLFSSRTSTSPLSSLFVVLPSLLKCKLVPLIASTSKKGRRVSRSELN